MEKRSFYCAFSLRMRMTNYLHETNRRLIIVLILQLFYNEMMLVIG